MELYLIRHTTPRVGKGICYGQSDVPLAESFDAEWTALREGLPPGVQCVYTSPLSRCRRLAERIAEHYGVPLHPDDRLRELNFGRWELQAWDALPEPELSAWMNDYVHVPCPGGESYAQLISRVASFVESLRTGAPGRTVVVTHAGVIRSGYAVLHGLSPEAAMARKVAYGEMHCMGEV
jgi:alpha-ribazole phosphatase